MTTDDILRVMREFLGPESENWAVDEALLEEWLPFLQALAAAAAAAERERMISEGWRQCAQGQKTSQFCGMVEQERERLIRMLATTEFTSLEHMPHEAATIMRAGYPRMHN